MSLRFDKKTSVSDGARIRRAERYEKCRASRTIAEIHYDGYGCEIVVETCGNCRKEIERCKAFGKGLAPPLCDSQIVAYNDRGDRSNYGGAPGFPSVLSSAIGAGQKNLGEQFANRRAQRQQQKRPVSRVAPPAAADTAIVVPQPLSQNKVARRWQKARFGIDEKGSIVRVG